MEENIKIQQTEAEVIEGMAINKEIKPTTHVESQDDPNPDLQEPEIIAAPANDEVEDEVEQAPPLPEDPKDLEIRELKTHLADQVEMVNAIKRQHGDAVSEFNNVKTRLKREVNREVQNSLKALISELLETVDNLDRAIEAAQSQEEDSELLTGVTMVRDQFTAKLSNLGVQRVKAMGATFTPSIHEAISMVPIQDPDQDHKVVAVIKEGYTMNGEVLRAAMVAVGEYKEPAPQQEPEEEAS